MHNYTRTTLSEYEVVYTTRGGGDRISVLFSLLVGISQMKLCFVVLLDISCQTKSDNRVIMFCNVVQ